MELDIIKIGNSRGIRFNKSILEKYHFTNKLEMQLENDCIILKPINEVRKNWDSAFKSMRSHEDDSLVIDSVFEDECIEDHI
jgi:antitoxin MazE